MPEKFLLFCQHLNQLRDLNLVCEIQIIIPSGLWSVHGTLAIDNHHACVSILCFQQSLMQYTLCLNIPMKMRRKVGHGFCPRMNFTFI